MNIIIQIIVAIAAVVSAAMLLYLARLAYCYKRSARLFSIYTALVQQSNIIESAIGEFGIGGPYASLLDIPEDQHERFGHYATVFFHQLRLLSTVFQCGINQKLLMAADVDRFGSWTRTVFKPWVEANAYLSGLLDKVLSQEDLYGKKFLTWLKALMK